MIGCDATIGGARTRIGPVGIDTAAARVHPYLGCSRNSGTCVYAEMPEVADEEEVYPTFSHLNANDRKRKSFRARESEDAAAAIVCANSLEHIRKGKKTRTIRRRK